MHKALAPTHNHESFCLSISEDILEPLVLPQYSHISLRVAHGISAHLIAPSALNINIVLEPQSSLYWYSLSNPELILNADLHAKARLCLNHINLLGASTCHMDVNLLEEEAHVDFYGLDQLYATSKSFVNLNIKHHKPYTKSSQSFRGLYADESLGNFIGSVNVFPHAHHASARQLYKAILLSENAHALVKPELEINNFDITASHGASIGQLDPESLFYLCSRGLSLKAAYKILVHALAQDIIQEIHPLMRDYLSAEVDRSLEILYHD
jgi:Fe-S cluster assembly scaffold protein SufB